MTRGGGVLLAIHHSLPSRQFDSPSDLETVTVQLMIMGSPLICVVYVPPNSDTSYYASLISYLDSISATHRIIILADFNSPGICWSTLHAPSKSLCDLLFRRNLSQMVDFPTHINGNTLDLVISSPEVHISDLKILSSPLRSDHYMLGFTSPLLARHRADSSFSRVSLNYKKADFDNMSSFLLDHDFSSYYQSSDIEFLWHYIKDTILLSISLYTPVIKKRSHLQPPWFTSSIRHQLHKVHSLRKKCKHNPSPHNASILSAAESTLHTDISTARVAFESSLVDAFAYSKDSKIYDYIRSFSKSGGILSELQYQSQTLTAATGKANASMISSILSSTHPVRMLHSLTYHFLHHHGGHFCCSCYSGSI